MLSKKNSDVHCVFALLISFDTNQVLCHHANLFFLFIRHVKVIGYTTCIHCFKEWPSEVLILFISFFIHEYLSTFINKALHDSYKGEFLPNAPFQLMLSHYIYLHFTNNAQNTNPYQANKSDPSPTSSKELIGIMHIYLSLYIYIHISL